jgi:protein-S-isoprenylcysteine O-methyltransferase Ste14
MKNAATRKLPPVWVLMAGFSALYGAVSVGLTALLRLPWTVSLPALPALVTGLVLVLGGGSLWLWAFRSLGAKRAMGKELFRAKSESKLVTDGVYAWTRNPLYVAATILFIGWFLVLRWTPLAFLTVLFAVHFVLVAKWEERELRERFGPEYEAYRARVPLFLPRIRRRGRT